MKVIVTGHSGFIGKHLCEALLKKHDIFRFDHDITEDFPGGKCDIIYHLAGISSGEKKKIFETNAEGTLRLASKFPDSRIVFVSSCAADNFDSFYGITKRFGECCSLIHKNWISLRLFNPYGPGQSLESGALIPRILNSKKIRQGVEVYGNGNQKRDFIYIDDAVKAIISFGESSLNGTFEIGSGKSISVKDVINLAMKNPDINYFQNKSVGIYDSQSKSFVRCFVPISEGLKLTEDWWNEKN